MATSEFLDNTPTEMYFPSEWLEDPAAVAEHGLRGTARLWMALDGLTALGAVAIATLYKLHVGPLSGIERIWHGSLIPGVPVWVLLALLCWYVIWLISISSRFKLYSPRKFGGFFYEQRKSVQACLTSGLILTGALYLLRTEEIPRSIIILTVGLVTVTLSLRRLVCRLLLYNDFRHGVGTRNALIVGTGPKAHALRNYLEREKSLGYTFRGFIGFPGADSNASAHSDAVVGSFDTLFQRARKKFIDVIILTGPFNYGPIDGIVEQAQIRGVDLRIVPDMYEGLHGQTPIEYFGPFPTILLHRSESPEIRLAIKRMFDILFSSAILITISPLLLAIAIAVKLDSRGPVFYTSERIGKKGRVFNCIKFRTMVRDAENRRAEVMHLNERDGVLFKISDDPRVTRLGRLLRKSSLDELPQFLNVLLGDMSTVGPRPPLGSEVEEYKLRHLRRLDVTPGITGLWQVQARQDPSFDSYVSLDVSYIENWSLGLDMKIILRTIGVVFSGTGS